LNVIEINLICNIIDPIKASYSTFGNIPYGFYLTGRIYYNMENKEEDYACRPLTGINLQPDVTPSYPDSTSTAYWILENYGLNLDFDTLISLDFERTGNLIPACDKNQLYTRMPNADGPVWGQAIDQADACIGALPNNKITFSTGNSVYQSGQFSIGAKMWAPTSNNWFSFSANPYREGTVLLDWTTGKELNTSHFIVERKEGAKGFKAIDSIAAAGNSGVSKNYQCIDKFVLSHLSMAVTWWVGRRGKLIYTYINRNKF
jgi:hypothetical protein